MHPLTWHFLSQKIKDTEIAARGGETQRGDAERLKYGRKEYIEPEEEQTYMEITEEARRKYSAPPAPAVVAESCKVKTEPAIPFP